jgi:hypothetical protein
LYSALIIVFTDNCNFVVSVKLLFSPIYYWLASTVV